MDTTNSSVTLKDKKEKPILVEVANAERKLWAIMQTKGLLNPDVKDLYEKICCSYEKIVLSDLEFIELQEVEYSLWKLHYWQIDEFRKRLKKSSGSEMTTRPLKPQNLDTKEIIGNHVEGLKLFLDEATKYYKGLLVKIRRYYGVPEEFSFYKHGGFSASMEPKRLQKLQFLFHRFLVCLGDLARYGEQCEKEDKENQDWSVAVSHYLEASMVWPDSGNPQNQLAVLATYIGDEFLALYHCVRSLAIKEPFPDAWNNLILLFERNRSADLNSLRSEAHTDPSKPCEGIVQMVSSSTNDLLKAESSQSGEKKLWPLLVRLIGFFFINCSLEDFQSTFATTMEELDVLMSLDDAKLKAALEAYQRIDSARRGPFRAIQVVSILIFVIERLINSPEINDLKNKDNEKQIMFVQMALTTTFTFMARVAARCLKAKVTHDCLLLPALLVFTEWLSGILEKIEMYISDDKCKGSISHFFASFLKLLKQFDINREESSRSIALWEDYELRGFQPLARSHSSFDFSTCLGYADGFESGARYRTHRIIDAAIKIADMPTITQKWIFYNKSARKFYAADSRKFPDEEMLEKVESHNIVGHSLKSVEQEEEELILQKPSSSPRKSAVADEDEVILFKPLMRYNSAPISSINSNDQSIQAVTDEKAEPADECLRRATSLLIAQNQGKQQDPSALQYDITNFQFCQPMKLPESTEASVSPGSPSFSAYVSAGPPSLNAWVVNRGNLSSDRAKGKNDKARHTLTPIDEMSSTFFSDLSISETRDPIPTSGIEAANTYYSSTTYAAPVPSAPFLPDDAVWLNNNQSTFSNYDWSGRINATNGFLDATRVTGHSNWNISHQPQDYATIVTGPVHGYQPSRPMTSSEWLRHYRENNNHQPFLAHTWSANYTVENNGNFYGYDVSTTGPFDHWGTPLASNPLIYEQNTAVHLGSPPAYVPDYNNRVDKVVYGYQKSSPYVCGAVSEPEPLLQFLKEKEWLLQQDQTLRGPAYMGR